MGDCSDEALYIDLGKHYPVTVWVYKHCINSGKQSMFTVWVYKHCVSIQVNTICLLSGSISTVFQLRVNCLGIIGT